MTQLLATNFVNAFECSYPDSQFTKEVCDEYENYIERSASGDDIILLVFKDQSVLILDTTEDICYEFAEPEHALEFLSENRELAKKHLSQAK